MKELLGSRIRERREELRISQEDLAKTSNVSRATISAIENGKCTDVLVGTLLAISKALDTTIDNFFCDDCPNDLTKSMDKNGGS